MTFLQASFQRLKNHIAIKEKNPIQITTSPLKLASPAVSQELQQKGKSNEKKREAGDNENALHDQSPEKTNDSNNHNQHVQDSKCHQLIQ